MPGLFSIFFVLLAGFGLGVLFYGGLWMTIRALPGSRHPTLLALGSFWGRTALVLAGLTLAMAHRWQNGIACLAGFIVAHIALAHRVLHTASGKGVE